MSWAKIDDGFLDHPKALRAGEDAANLYLRGLIYCRKHKTGGVIPREALEILSRKPERDILADKLVAVTLWERDGHDGCHGWRIHDYEMWNGDDEELKAEHNRRLARDRQKVKRDMDRAVTAVVTQDVTHAVTSENVTSSVTLARAQTPARPHADARAEPIRTQPEPEPNPEEQTAAADAEPSTSAVASPKTSKRPDDPIPFPGSIERSVYDAIVTGAKLRGIVARPAELARTLADPGAYPGVDPVALVKHANAWLLANPKAKKRNGAAFLVGWFNRTQERVRGTNRVSESQDEYVNVGGARGA